MAYLSDFIRCIKTPEFQLTSSIFSGWQHRRDSKLDWIEQLQTRDTKYPASSKLAGSCDLYCSVKNDNLCRLDINCRKGIANKELCWIKNTEQRLETRKHIS